MNFTSLVSISYCLKCYEKGQLKKELSARNVN